MAVSCNSADSAQRKPVAQSQQSLLDSSTGLPPADCAWAIVCTLTATHTAHLRIRVGCIRLEAAPRQKLLVAACKAGVKKLFFFFHAASTVAVLPLLSAS